MSNVNVCYCGCCVPDTWTDINVSSHPDRQTHSNTSMQVLQWINDCQTVCKGLPMPSGQMVWHIASWPSSDTDTPTHTNTHQHTPTHTNTHQHTPTHTNTHQHTPTHTCTHQHTPTHTNTNYLLRVLFTHFWSHNYSKYQHFEGFRPEWYISTIIYSGDTPFWTETLHLLPLCATIRTKFLKPMLRVSIQQPADLLYTV